MRYLVTVWDAGGSVPPELAVVRRLVRAGHDVTVLAGPPLRSAVEATGATFSPWRDVPHRADPADPDPFSDVGLAGPKVVQLLLDQVVAGPAARYVQEVDRALVAHRSDALVSSMLMLGGLVAAEARGVPAAVLMPNCYLVPTPGMPPFGMPWAPARGLAGRARIAAMNAVATRLWDRGLPALNAARSDVGLTPLQHVFDQHRHARRVLVLTSRAFDFPAELPPNVHYTGPELGDPDWAARPATAPEGDGPLVLVSTSTTDMGQVDLLRRIVAALDRLPVRGLVTTGPGVDPGLVPGSDRVAIVPAAAHRDVLPHAAAVVSHGGHGTVIKALAAGLPQLALPLGRDQPNNAARVVDHGVGLRLAPGAAPRTIAGTLERLLHDPDIARRAADLGATVRADAEHSTVVAHLEEIVTGLPAH
jgi:MGT family glycosyltransferase